MSVLELFGLHGKKALVTGASSGIGKEVARAYVQAAAELTAAGGRVLPIPCDVTQPDQVDGMLDRMTAELGGIDIAVCNAGIITVTPMLEMPPAEFQRIQDTNVTGVFLTDQAAARAMVRQGGGGV